MATARIRNIENFDENLETWESYCERLGQFFEANGKKKASLLSLIGPKTYSLLRNLCAPDKPSAKTYNQLVDLLNAQLNPKPSVIAIKANNQNLTLNKKLNAFLCKYRITPHMITNETPSMLLYGKNIRIRLDISKPNTRDVVNRKQHQMMGSKMDSTVKQYEIGEPVLVRDYSNNQKWEEGLIHSRTEPLSYKVSMGNDMVWRRHTDQIRPSSPNTIPEPLVIQNPTMEDNNQYVPETQKTPATPSNTACATQIKTERRHPDRIR